MTQTEITAFTSALEQVWKNFNGKSFSSGVLGAFISEFKKAIQFASELDSLMMDVARSSDITKTQLQHLNDSSLDLSKNLSTSAKNVLAAVKTYADASTDAREILHKSQSAVMLSNASGNAAREAGLSLQEYAAMSGLAIKKTGLTGNTIGDTYKTMLSRLTSASFTEGTPSEDIIQAEAALHSIGVEIRTTDGSFRDFSDTMADLAKIWDTLSSSEKSELSFRIAGTTQTDVMDSLFGSWEAYESMMAGIGERSGTALQLQKEYAESLQGKLNESAALSQSIGHNLIDSDEVKATVEVFNNLLHIVDHLTESFGLWGTLGLGGGLFAGVQNIGKHVQAYIFQKILSNCFEYALHTQEYFQGQGCFGLVSR